MLLKNQSQVIFFKINELIHLFSFNGTQPIEKSAPYKSTTHIHDGIQMTEYENEPFVIGDYKHNKVEFLHLSHEQWYTASPFRSEKPIFGYSAVSRPGKVFILGGCCDHWQSVSIFENDEWQYHGKLGHGRMNFMTITYGTDLMIIGGTPKNATTKS